MKTAVILAGGKGTRLAGLSGDLPKPLVPVGGIPVVERQIALLARYGFRRVFLTTGYRADVLEQRLGDGSRWGVELQHVREEHPLGTAGGVAALGPRLRDDFLVLYGDVQVHMDLDRLFAFHRNRDSGATLVVHPNDHPFDSDLVDLDGAGRIRAFHPAPRPAGGPDLRNMVSAAVYVLSPRALDHIRPDVKQDFVRDVFPRMLDAGTPIYGYHSTEYLKDMGTPDRLARVERDLAGGVVEAMHADNRRPALFLDRDGVINREDDGVHRPQGLQLLAGAGPAIRRVNRAGWLAVTVTNQPAVAKGFMSERDLEAVHRRLESLLGEDGAWLDAILYCPHHPERGFDGERPELKVDCACRKPEPGLLERAATELPLDRTRAVMVGDSWRDMAAAHAFGADAIGVRTGHAMSHPAPPEYVVSGRADVVVEDLAQAVALVLDPDPAVEGLADELAGRAARPGERLGVLIGGRARAGKSTSAFRLRRALGARGVRALSVRLDDWIVPASRRPAASELADRYLLAEAAQAFRALLAGRKVVAPGYDALSRERSPSTVEYDPEGCRVLILEGVPALSIETDDAVVRVHVDAPGEPERLARWKSFYAQKGLNEEATAELLREREAENALVDGYGRAAGFRWVPARLETEGESLKP